MQESGNLSSERPGPVQQASTSLTLLERVKQREAEGWHRLVTLYQPLVVWWCRRKGLPTEDAEDVAQEVFLTVNARVAEFRKGPRGGSFRGWLHRITDHKVGDYLRKQNKAPRAPGGSEAQDQLQRVPDSNGGSSLADDGSERAILCRHAMELVRDQFEAQTWEAAWRVVVEGQRPADVAADLGMSRGAIYTAKSRVLSRLREELEGLLD
jgi:RNA polymerase sigma-70 factor, ECF subfamily